MLDRRQFCALAATPCLTSAIAARENIAPRDVTWLSEVQRPPEVPAEQEVAPLVSPGETLPSWLTRRRAIRKRWREFLVPIEPAGAVPSARIVHQERVGEVVRQLLRYESEPGWPTEAYVLRPAGAARPRAGVVVFHSTVPHSIRQPAGVEGKAEKAFAIKLARRGFVAVCPRNFLWPDNHRIDAHRQTDRFEKRHPESKGMAKMLHDARVAVDLLISQPEVDRERIGAVGHSLGAKEVLYLAAFDERVKVAVSSEGGIGTQFSNWDAPWYLGATIKDFASIHEHHELLALAAPRPFLLIGGDSADGDRSWPYIEAVLPVYRLYSDTARVGLLNHKRGHSVPPLAEDRIYQWLETYLN